MGSVRQFQPVPLMAVTLRPAGALSVTVTVPLVDPADAMLPTAIMYVPLAPAVKVTLCVFEMVSTGGFGAVTLMETVAVWVL